MGFLDNIFNPTGGSGDNNNNNNKNNNNNDKKKKSNTGSGSAGAAGGGIQNPFANLVGGNKNKAFKGQGQSLGGSKPGVVIPIILPNPGPLGIRVEKKTNNDASAIVNEVIPDSQAQTAGLQRGDILCFAGSNGQEEIMYDMFLQLAKSDQRPIHMEVRRLTTPGTIDGTKQRGGGTTGGGTTTITAGSNNNSNNNKPSSSSADAEVRRKAMIAAAEAREKAHKSKTKLIKHVTKSTLLAQQQQQQQSSSSSMMTTNTNDEPLSEASKIAISIAKHDEAMLAAKLGYNPYEVAKSTAGQARNATTTVQHGMIGGETTTTTTASSNATPSLGGGNHYLMQPGVVSEPSNPTLSAVVEQDKDDYNVDTDDTIIIPPPNDEFELAYATILSTPDINVSTNSISIMKKLIVNATTKGQIPPFENESSSSKFRKVRLGNPKIANAIVDVPGAIDLMLSVGFELVEIMDSNNDDGNNGVGGESCLIYPADYTGPVWLPRALKRMEQYHQSHHSS